MLASDMEVGQEILWTATAWLPEWEAGGAV